MKLFGEINIILVVDRNHTNARFYPDRGVGPRITIGASYLIASYFHPRIFVDDASLVNYPRSIGVMGRKIIT
jgi:hypothetical protein